MSRPVRAVENRHRLPLPGALQDQRPVHLGERPSILPEANMKRTQSRFVAVVSALLAAGFLVAGGPAYAVDFLAVGAGDATTDGAVLWTRAQQSGNPAGLGLIAQVSTDPAFSTI